MRKWFVWNPSGYAPTFQHDSEASARSEAQRLALMNPGQRFLILVSTAECIRQEVSWTEHEKKGIENDLPF